MATSGKITNQQKTKLAVAITKQDMLSIAENCMNMTPENLENMEAEHGSKTQVFNQDVLKRWMYRNPGKDQIKTLVRLLYEANESYGTNVNMEKVLDILGVSEEEVLGEGKDSGVKESDSNTTHQVKNANPKTEAVFSTQSIGAKDGRPGLTSDMVITLSKHITSEADLHTVGVSGLSVESNEVDRLINKYRDVTDSAREVLKLWKRTCKDDQEAYEKLCNALDSVKMPFLKNFLK